MDVYKIMFGQNLKKLNKKFKDNYSIQIIYGGSVNTKNIKKFLKTNK